jgi:hypothetical protein
MQPARIQSPDVIPGDEIAGFKHIRNPLAYQGDIIQTGTREDNALFLKEDNWLPLARLHSAKSLSFETRSNSLSSKAKSNFSSLEIQSRSTVTPDGLSDRKQSMFTGITGHTGYILIAFLLIGSIIIIAILVMFLLHLRASQRQEKDGDLSI